MALKLSILGGLGEIGMNCMGLEFEDELIIVDCGILFTDLESFGCDYAIPNFKYLLERKEKIRAIVATHGHEDHIGAISYLIKLGVRCPIYGSPFTCLLIEDRLRDAGVDHLAEVKRLEIGKSVSFKHFSIRSESVNHSIIEATALFIDTPIGKIIHTGDFKMDPSPYYGSQMDLSAFKKAGEEGVLLLMSDSTNVEVDQHTVSERFVYSKFEEIFAMAQGMIVVSTFSSNIARMGQVFELAKKTGRKVAVTGRSMVSNLELARASGYVGDAEDVFISIDQIDKISKSQLVVLSTGSQGEARSALNRVSVGEHRDIEVGPGDLVVMSSKFIPGNEIAISRVINQLFRQGADVLYDAIHDVHVSGHAARPELRLMLQAVKPKFFIPVHGEYRHLVHHARLAVETGVPRDHVVVASNGDILEVSKDGITLVDQYEEIRCLIETSTLDELKRETLKGRRRLAESGCVLCLTTRNGEYGKVLSGPEIIFRGVVEEDQSVEWIEQCRKVALKAIKEASNPQAELVPTDELQEAIRVDLRRYLRSRLNKKVEVISIVIDL